MSRAGDRHSSGEPRNRLFPVGLYATLLVGVFGVTFPELIAPVESLARTAVTLPLRAYSILFDGRPALAASEPKASLQGVVGLSQSTLRGGSGPVGYSPRVCLVVDRRVGPLGVVDELILARSRDELMGCAPLVTVGHGLVGFLDIPAHGRPGDRGAQFGKELARVRLLHYRGRRRATKRPLRARDPFPVARVAAQVTCREVDAQGVLNFLVVPARAVDSWPLRCTLLDNPYLGSRLRHSGDMVTTSETDDRSIPAGLQVGRLMIWGYPQLNIPVGLFVEPIRDPRGISSVVVWEAADGGSVPASTDAKERLIPVSFSRFPAPRPVRERWLVTSNAGSTLPNGAALLDRALDGGRLLGLLARPWSGQSLVTSFSASTRIWAFLLRSLDGHVHELVGRVVGHAPDGRLRVKILAPDNGWRLRGELLTGVNGPHCPAGLAIGRAEPGEAGVADVTTPGTPRVFSPPAARGELLVTIPDSVVSDPRVFVSQRVLGTAR